MVLIDVGIMERDNYSILKPVRGKKLPLKPSETTSASKIKILAIDKHASHNQNFCGLEDYVLLYADGKEVIKLPEASTGTGEKKGKQFTLCEYIIELGKPYSQIVFYLCIASEFKETFENNCETASSVELKNQAKSILILENANGNVNDDALHNFFINDFSLDYLNPATNNQEFTLNNETPIFKSCTTAPVNNQENQAQTMKNQTLHNTNQFMLQQKPL